MFMPQTIASLPPDSDPPARVPFDIPGGRCHAVQVVRHVSLPQLEALHEPHSGDNKTHEVEDSGQTVARDEGERDKMREEPLP